MSKDIRLETTRVPVYALDGSTKEDVEVQIPRADPLRDDLILRAWIVAQANSTQPQGRSPEAGRGVSAISWNTGRGMSRVPRMVSGRAAFISSAKGGHLAHPPRAEEITRRKMNKKERDLANLHALAASFDLEAVKSRNHLIPEKLTSLPIVVDGKIEDIEKTSEAYTVLGNLGLSQDVERAKDGRKVKSGRGKMRGRGKRSPRSLLLVVSAKDAKLRRAAKNMVGVEVKTPEELGIPFLAPGGKPGRLIVWSRPALERAEQKWLKSR
ncbi:MAG: 50S ribosomal protein L4 [Thermoprotei archaeon]|nr:50S ribosomal protein L4 [TACK group archaeon]